VLSGDSAGGGLALAAALALPRTADGTAVGAAARAADGAADGAAVGPAVGAANGAVRLAGCILLSPWLDLSADRTAVPRLVRRDVVLSPAWLEACAQAYAPVADLRQPTISPLHASLGGLPPLLIQCGTDDLLAPDAERMAARAEAAGLDVTYTWWPGMWHDFALQPDILAAADSAVAQAAWFLARVCAEG
jgi:epsilon-lactone hydrolase